MKTRARPRCRQKIIKGFHQSSNDCLTRIDCRNDTCFKPLQKVPAHAASRGVPKLGTVTVARLVAGDASLLVSCQPFEFSLSPCAQVLVSPCKSLLRLLRKQVALQRKRQSCITSRSKIMGKPPHSSNRCNSAATLPTLSRLGRGKWTAGSGPARLTERHAATKGLHVKLSGNVSLSPMA